MLTGGVFVPAAGQGVIAVQARSGSASAAAAAAADHARTHACLDEERRVVRALGASCHTPVGVLADAATACARFVGLPDGSEWLVEEAASGDELARRLLAAGAADLLSELRDGDGQRARRDGLPRRRRPGRSGAADRAGARADRARPT